MSDKRDILNSKLLARDHSKGQSAAPRLCEWPNCIKSGEHRAPRSPDDLNSYRWFCLDHARLYNRNWNYFDGMSDDEVEADRRADTVWRRPSWPLVDGPPTHEQINAFWRGDYSDPFNVFHESLNKPHSHPEEPTYSIGLDIKKALETLGLSMPVEIKGVKAAYKVLVKRHHPDAAGNDGDDAQIKEINEAYRVILDFLIT